MYCPAEEYLRNNYMQQKEAEDVLHKYVEKMTWKSDEIVLDVGCGPGDVSINILYQHIKNNINQLVCIDKSSTFIEYAKKNYESTKIDFNILDIENSNECCSYTRVFDKIFSFLCFNWVENKLDALINMGSMLKDNGEICIHYLFDNPINEIYKKLDPEWHIYTKKTSQANIQVYSKEETKALFENAGFRIISIETNERKFTCSNLASGLNMFKSVDEMYNILPPKEHEKYSIQVKDKIPKTQMVEFCPITEEYNLIFFTITVHAVKHNI